MISVVLPTYNRANLLIESIQSILDQTYSNFELIIIDDGSTDNTFQIISELGDSRINYVSYPKNQGVSFARNKGLEIATGKYIAFMDSDDISKKERFFEQVNFMEANSEIDICGTNIQFFGSRNIELKYSEQPLPFMLKALFQTPFHFPSTMIRRSFLKRNEILFRPEVRAADDYYFLMKIVSIGKSFVIQKPLYLYRWHETSISFQDKNIQSQNELDISQLAFSKIAGIELTHQEAEIIYLFYRNILPTNHLNKANEVVKKIIKNASSLKLTDTKILNHFLEKKLVQTYLQKSKIGENVTFAYLKSGLFFQKESVQILKNTFIKH